MCSFWAPKHFWLNVDGPGRIELTEDELSYAVGIGRLRNRDAKALGLQDKHGYKGQGDDAHVLGAMAELAFAKFCGVEWAADNLTFKRPDVGGVQVRGRSELGFQLIFREDDDPTEPFALVVGTGPFYVLGWIPGYEAAKAPLQAIGGREPAHFVPHSWLRPLTTPLPGRLAVPS